MADVITRFKLETTQYDSALRNAAQQLNEYGSRAMAAGREFQKFTKGQAEVAREFGNIAVAAKNPKDKVKELVAAFNEAAKAYNALTKEQQQSDWGKGLAESLQTLKVRISDAKKELYDFGDGVKGSGGLTGALDQLAGKFGMNIQQLAGWGTAIGAAKVALDVAKDAFFQSESNIDEWGRTVQGANFFSNLTTAVQGARDLYDSLDRLGSIKSNNAAAVAIVQQEIAELRLLKQSGEDVDTQIKDATARLAALQKQSVDAGKKAGRDSIGNIIRNEYNTQKGANPLSGGSINRAVDDILKNGQAAFDKYKQTFERLEKKAADTRVTAGSASATGVTSGTERYTNLEKLTDEERKQYFLAKSITEGETRIQQGIALYAQSVQEGTASAREEFKGNRYALTGSGGYGGGKTGGGDSTTTVAKELSPLQQAQKEISALTEEALTADEARRKVIKEEIADLQKQVEEYKKIQDYVTGKEVTKTIEPSKVNKPKTVDDMLAEERIKMETQTTGLDKTTLSTILRDSIKNNINVGNTLDSAILEIQAGIDVPDATWQAIIDEYNALREQIGLEPITIKFETGELEKVDNATKDVGKSMKFAASMTQTLGSALSAIEDPGAKVAATVAQAIANVALAYADTLAKDQTSKWNIFSFIAAAAAATVSMATTIASIHSATGYAEGGIIKGNSYSGDRIGGIVDGRQLVGLNAGELVLNKAQQANLAAELTKGSDGGRFSSTPYVTGEKIVLGINNWAKRNGKGELVFSR